MVYIVGIGHSVQCDKNFSFSITEEFIRDIKRLVVDSGIKLIAEEFSLEALSLQIPPILSTTIKDITEELEIHHKYCDPDHKERGIIGWKSSHDDTLRLKNWLEKIVDNLNDPIIFICGNQHVMDFTKLIKNQGCDVFIYPKVYLSKKDKFYDSIKINNQNL